MKYGPIIKEIGRGAKGARDLDTAAAAGQQVMGWF